MPEVIGRKPREVSQTYQALEALETKEQRVQQYKLPSAARRFPTDDVHGSIFPECDTSIHPPPLVVILKNHHHSLRGIYDQIHQHCPIETQTNFLMANGEKKKISGITDCLLLIMQLSKYCLGALGGPRSPNEC